MIRIIPRLDIKGPNLVKGIHLEGLRVLGKPEDFARYYFEEGADELIYIDVVASLYGRNSLHEIIRRTAREIFIPLTVGGGIRSIDDIQAVLRAGADKVSLNTAAIKNPDLIRQASRKFGSSTILISIEAIRHSEGGYEAYTDNGREATGVNVFEWAQRVAELGAGEIMVTCINQEGTGKGFDLQLTRRISESVPVPVIACGGAGKLEDAYRVISEGKAQGVAMASMFHYGAIRHFGRQAHDFFGEGNIEFLKSNRNFTKVQEVTISELKAYLAGQEIECRLLGEAVEEQRHVALK